ncbi:hypothetical protein K2173_018806 [Erythroxylum novogranatense]|uniref:Serine aminopeptidase S33 domain-containing protein n=1 Tax=Erythroxylum novogranatense TaxID=1862640 RepID=A0AAV8SAX2_9ROSI|nr:hypothetical protein K2173_018806 [Erythroxylum novogranatense]
MADCTSESPYGLLLTSIILIPVCHYVLFFFAILLLFLYNFLEIHFLRHLLKGFRGDLVTITCNFSSDLYCSVVSSCRILHGRYSPTPWLSSPHLQTAFLSLFANSPNFSYRRELFHASDGGTIALDWLLYSDVKEDTSSMNETILSDDNAPVVIVIPGLTSDSADAYVRHIAFKMARHGWNVVVSNHRGLGGISITSDCFYNAGWTEDIRKVIGHIHCCYPEAPLYAVGTSIGANILVKYLGEDGDGIPLIGAAAVCSPWDLLVCDRFINRRLTQKFYDRVLAVGLKGYAQLHQSVLSRLTDMDNIKKSCSVRDFDHHATRVLGKFETVDTYYRHSSSANFVGNVSVPLLCISSLDDPVCTREAIPWDECRANENIILATTHHGGHLAYFEGLTANSLWWVRAVNEFFNVLHSSSLRNRKRKSSSWTVPLESSIDQGPYVNVMENGMVTAVGDTEKDIVAEHLPSEDVSCVDKEPDSIKREMSVHMTEQIQKESDSNQPPDPCLDVLIDPVRQQIGQLLSRSRVSIWLLAYVAIMTTWPLAGSALLLFIKKRFKNFLPATLLRR